MYGIVDDDPNSKNGGVLLGEVVGEGEDMQVLGILPEEKDMVLAYYNEISTQLGEDEFLNAVYAYLISTKESIGQYLDNK